jgi:hypothetical protein
VTEELRGDIIVNRGPIGFRLRAQAGTVVTDAS